VKGIYISLALGFVSIPWGMVICLIPTKPFEFLFKFIWLVRGEEALPVIRPDQESLDGTISMVYRIVIIMYAWCPFHCTFLLLIISCTDRQLGSCL
jgi:hypothetical protein